MKKMSKKQKKTNKIIKQKQTNKQRNMQINRKKCHLFPFGYAKITCG